MKQITEKEIEKLTVDEKLKLIEQLWDDINQETLENIPAHHKKILIARIEKLNNEKMIFKKWDDIKQKYLM